MGKQDFSRFYFKISFGGNFLHIIFQTIVKNIVVGAMAPCVIRSSAARVLIM